MQQHEIRQRRLRSQQIVEPTFAEPGAVVRWLGAVQAQDYLGALWAVGARTPGATEQTVEQALAERRVGRRLPARLQACPGAAGRAAGRRSSPRPGQGGRSREPGGSRPRHIRRSLPLRQAP